MVIFSVKEKLDLLNPTNLMKLRMVIKGHVNTKLQQSKIEESQARCVRFFKRFACAICESTYTICSHSPARPTHLRVDNLLTDERVGQIIRF